MKFCNIRLILFVRYVEKMLAVFILFENFRKKFSSLVRSSFSYSKRIASTRYVFILMLVTQPALSIIKKIISLLTNCWSVFDHFVGLVLKVLSFLHGSRFWDFVKIKWKLPIGRPFFIGFLLMSRFSPSVFFCVVRL